MASTDTVVGIAGAILLAAVMVGVFVYEYNNTPQPTQGMGDQSRIDAFHAKYPLLNATGDIDGDHKMNYNDTDMDGNGVPDANQTTDIAHTVRGSPTVSAPRPPEMVATVPYTVHAEQGAKTFTARMDYNTTSPGPVGGTLRVPTITLSVKAPDGTTTTANAQQSGTQVSATLSLPASPGAYTVTLSESTQGAGPDTVVALKIVVDYGTGK